LYLLLTQSANCSGPGQRVVLEESCEHTTRKRNQVQRSLWLWGEKWLLTNARIFVKNSKGTCRIRSYLSTMRKQGHAMLAALAAVFVDKPFPVAWGT